MPYERTEKRQSALHLGPLPAVGQPWAAVERARLRKADARAFTAGQRLPAVDSCRLADHLPDGILRFDRGLTCVYANPAVESTLGRPPEAVTGRSVGQLGLPKKLALLWEDNLRLVFATSQARAIEIPLATPSGERHLDLRIVPADDPDGGGDAVLAVLQDITDRKRAEHALLSKTEELQRINSELEEFAYVASHDLKAPLRTAHSLSSWIEEEVCEHLSDDGRHRLQLMRDRLRQMDDLINATLEYSRAGARIAACEPVAVADVVTEAVQAQTLPEGFSISVPPRLPVLHTDRQLLNQVLTNLIANAVIHHDRSDGRVWLTASDLGDAFEFGVIDDGPGIPPEYHQRIFHMFQRGPDRRPGSGSGIGLAVVKKLVERMGGNIALESAPGWGSTFTFTWPKGH